MGEAIDDAVENVQFACTISNLPFSVATILRGAPNHYKVDICTDPRDQSTATIFW